MPKSKARLAPEHMTNEALLRRLGGDISRVRMAVLDWRGIAGSGPVLEEMDHILFELAKRSIDWVEPQLPLFEAAELSAELTSRTIAALM